MDQESFIDYYENLQVSSNADSETVERVFRLLAKRYHPDNNNSGNAEKFRMVLDAFRVISNPEKRAAYDSKYGERRTLQWKIFDESSPHEDVNADRRIQEGVLALLYTTRRRDVSEPALGLFELERLLGTPEKHLEFHIWYLKEKGWIYRMDSGKYAITAAGVDTVIQNDLLLKRDRLLPPAEEPFTSGSKNFSSEEQAKNSDSPNLRAGQSWN